jgi:hypothetical protein
VKQIDILGRGAAYINPGREARLGKETSCVTGSASSWNIPLDVERFVVTRISHVLAQPQDQSPEAAEGYGCGRFSCARASASRLNCACLQLAVSRASAVPTAQHPPLAGLDAELREPKWDLAPGNRVGAFIARLRSTIGESLAAMPL